MNHLLVRYKILTNRGGSPALNAGNYLNVYWDDVALSIIVHQFSDVADITETVRTNGPDLGSQRARPTADFQITAGVTTQREGSDYKFCESTTLHTFQLQTSFPYAKSVLRPNNFSCIALVCDLTINDNPAIVNASDTTVNDGSIEITATSSNGPVKFSLTPDFDYTTSGQLSGLFSNMYAGTYTIYAKDALGCTDNIVVKIGVPDFHNPYYRLDYFDINKRRCRLDIEQRGYTGQPIPVKGTKDPVVLRYRGEGELNKFKPVIASEVTISLLSESNFYFRDLFSQDDRKYKAKYYKDYGNTVPAFVPATLDALTAWLQTPSSGSYAWVLGSNPSVSLNINGFTNKLYTLYAFEAGKSYSFNYSFDVTGTTGNIIISITNAQGQNLSSNLGIDVSTGTLSGTFTFVAPVSADRIRIYITQRETTPLPISLEINSFANATPSAGEQAAGLELKWQGYVLSSNYNESYIAPPYAIAITATDGLSDLKNFKFLDAFGNKFRDDIITLQALVECLKKTDQNFIIQAGINRFEADMATTETDDPLPQCKFDPNIFYEGTTISSCYDVITAILEPMGARLLQRHGKWLLYCIEEAVHEFAVREFDADGNYLSNGTLYDHVDIDKPVYKLRAAYRDQDQVQEVIPTFGDFFFIYKLLQNPSLVKSYSFEQEDVTDHDGIPAFKNWNIFIADAPGSTFGIKKTKAFEGDFNFFYKDNNYSPGGVTVLLPRPALNLGRVKLQSIDGLIEYDATDEFEVRFGYGVLLKAPIERQRAGRAPVWIRLQWMLKVGDYYYNEKLTPADDLPENAPERRGWTQEPVLKYNSIYVSSFNEVLDFKTNGIFREVDGLTLESFHVEFIFSTDLTIDLEDSSGLSNLKDVLTELLPIDTQLKLLITPSLVIQKRSYKLIDSTDSETLPYLVRPNDWDADDNPKMWQMTAPTGDPVLQPLSEAGVEYNYLDNVVFLHYPKGKKPVSNITIEKANNLNIKTDFEHEYLLNDIDIENINNSERTYKNYFKKLDGTPTQLWTRTYRAGTDKLLSLLCNDFVSQYKRQANKLTGSLIADVEMTPLTIMNEVFDGGRKYMFMGFELHDAENSVVFDMAEIKDVVTNADSDDIDAEFTTDFNLDFTS